MIYNADGHIILCVFQLISDALNSKKNKSSFCVTGQQHSYREDIC